MRRGGRPSGAPLVRVRRTPGRRRYVQQYRHSPAKATGVGNDLPHGRHRGHRDGHRDRRVVARRVAAGPAPGAGVTIVDFQQIRCDTREWSPLAGDRTRAATRNFNRSGGRQFERSSVKCSEGESQRELHRSSQQPHGHSLAAAPDRRSLQRTTLPYSETNRRRIRMRPAATPLVLLGAGVLALLSTVMPPAAASTTADVNFTGTWALDGGLDSPCPITMTKTPCPPTSRLVLDLPLQGDPVPQGHLEWTGNRRGITQFRTNTGAGGCTIKGTSGLNKQPPKQPGPFTHDCTMTSAASPSGKPNYVQGHCDLLGGQMFVVLTDALGQTYELDIHFSIPGGTPIGHWRKRGGPSQHGKVGGLLGAAPEGLPHTNTNSCRNKTATRFVVSGTFTITQDPALSPPP